jgi:tetratricopeptide (TPR) repeat protein
MNTPLMAGTAPARSLRPQIILCCAGIAVATIAAYSRSLGGAFLYDDNGSVLGNPTIRQFSTALQPPGGQTVSGRPILNLSFAVNNAVSGTGVWSYHVLNVVIHAAAALLVFGIVRRTLAAPASGPRSAPECLGLAFAAALLWAVHPLQTESVAYVVQRAESLMGLFYLATLYAFVRLAAPGSRAAFWAVVSVAACLLGMATKEVMATAPVVVLLYDRAFAAGSFREAWRRRKALYLSYAACWAPLAYLVVHAGGRGGTAGFGSGVPWWAYTLTQFKAVALYLRLSLWPNPLVGDYGRILEGHALTLVLCGLVVLSLVAATCLLLHRNSPLGFLGAWFFIILAPSSSVIPIRTEIMAEHRMYLSLAAVATLGVLALHAMLGRRLFPACVGVLAIGLVILTVRRTRVYQDSLTFWSDVVAKVPANAGGWNNLGNVLAEKGDEAGAIKDYHRALALAPAYAFAHDNLGKALVATGHAGEAITHFGDALRFQPEDPSIHFELGNALAMEGRGPEAAAEFREVVRLDPARANAWSCLGEATAKSGDLAAAADAYSHAVQLQPDSADARANYGGVLALLGRFPDAVREFREALRLDPGAADVHNNLGSLLAETGKLAEARAEFEEAIRLKPDYREARENLERLGALEQPGGGR